MTGGRVDQASVPGILADHRRRIRALEATPPIAQFDIKIFADNAVITIGDGAFIFAVPADLDGTSLLDVAAYVTTVSSSGLPTIQVRNETTTNDMLTTPITIDVGETTSYTSAAPAVIDATHQKVSVGDLIAIDVDVAGTGAKGLGVILDFYA